MLDNEYDKMLLYLYYEYYLYGCDYYFLCVKLVGKRDLSEGPFKSIPIYRYLQIKYVPMTCNRSPGQPIVKS